MKKSIKLGIVILSSISLLLGGCSLSKEDIPEANEYLSDSKNTETDAADEASTLSSEIVVINDLFEPVIKEEENQENASEAAVDASTAEVSLPEEKQKDPVNIVFFGDSQLANGRGDETDIPHLMGKRIPNSRIYNLAIGGTSATVENSTTDVSLETLTSTSFFGMANCFVGKSDRNATLAAGYPDILETMNSIDPKDVDYYVLSYGTNDFINNSALDCSTYEPVSAQAHALYNAMTMAIDTLKDASPDARFIILTPFYGIYVADDGTYIGDSYIVSNGVGTLSEYADKIKNVAEDRDAILFDGMYQSKFDLYLDTASEYLADNLHLSLTGRQIVARLVSHEINFREENEPFAYLDTDYIKISEFDPYEDYRYAENMMKKYYTESWDKYIKGEFPLAQPTEEALAQYQKEQEEQQEQQGDN